MHISEGVCPLPLLVGGFATTGLLSAWTLPALQRVSAPRVAVFTAAFFAASLLQLRVGYGSVHLSLLGLTGVVLGRAALPAILVGVTLQAVLFGHGGVSTLGLNVTIMGSGALLAGGIWRLGRTPSPWRAGLAAALGTSLSLALFAGALLSAGEELRAVAGASFALHAPILLVEIALTALAVRFLARVQPSLLDLPLPPPEAAPPETARPGGASPVPAAPQDLAPSGSSEPGSPGSPASPASPGGPREPQA